MSRQAPYETDAIRVFISSTFLDMQAERDLVVNVVFPNLRRRFRTSGRELIDIDLRWGITDEQAKLGQTIGLCLGEIDRCRPYFVGLVGERYGWIPARNEVSDHLRQAFPLLTALEGRSITEIEFEYAALANPERALHAIFLVRDMQTSASDSQDPQDPQQAALLKLRERVFASGLNVATYNNLETLASVLEDRLAAVLSSLLDKGVQRTPTEMVDLLHQSFAATRRRNYQGAKARFTPLDHWAGRSDSPALLIEGESGLGKSALIASWTEHRAESGSADLIVCHFIGASSESATSEAIMQRVNRLIAAVLGELTPADLTGSELHRAFAGSLERGGAKARETGGQLIFALDGLDKLQPSGDLRWLPRILPPGVKLLASALPGRAFDEMVERGTARYLVPSMSDAERRGMVKIRLGEFAKTLSDPRMQLIVTHELAGSPLFLQTMINELRAFGRHHDLDAQIADHLASSSVEELFDRVLTRMEKDCGIALTADVLGLIYLSRSGLEETVLLEATQAARIHVSEILLRLGDGLWEHAGRLSFTHDHLRNAVAQRYLKDDARMQRLRRALVNQFSLDLIPPDWSEYLDFTGPSWISVERNRTPHDRRIRVEKIQTAAAKALETGTLREGEIFEMVVDDPVPVPAQLARRIEELPFQLAALGDLASLRLLLSDLRWFEVLAKRGQSELREHWLAAGLKGPQVEKALVDAVTTQYPPHMRWTRRQYLIVWQVINFLKEADWVSDSAYQLMQAHTQLAGALRGNAHPSAWKAERDLAAVASSIGRHEEAASILATVTADQEAMFGESHPSTLASKVMLSTALRADGQLAEARAIIEGIMPLIVDRYGPDDPERLDAEEELATVLNAAGEKQRATDLRKTLLDRYLRVKGPDDNSTLELMSRMAIALRQQGDALAATAIHERVLKGRRATLGPDHPGTIKTLHSYGLALSQAGKAKAAEDVLLEAIRLSSADPQLGNVLRESRRALADAFLLSGQLDHALTQEKALLADFEQAGLLETQQGLDCVGSYGAGLCAFGHLTESETVLRKAVAIADRLGGVSNERVFEMKASLAATLIEAKKLPEAVGLLEEVVASQRRLTAPHKLEERFSNLLRLMQVFNTQKQFAATIGLGEDLPASPPIGEGAFAQVIECREALALAHASLKDTKDAIDEYGRIIQACVETNRSIRPSLMLQYSALCFIDGQTERARQSEAIALQLLMSTGGIDPQTKLAALMEIGQVGVLRYQRGDYAGAQAVYQYILENEIRIFGASSPHAASTKAKLVKIGGDLAKAAKSATPASLPHAERLDQIVADVLTGSDFKSDAQALITKTELLLKDATAVQEVSEALARRAPPLTLLNLTPLQLAAIADAMIKESMVAGAVPSNPTEKSRGWWPFKRRG